MPTTAQAYYGSWTELTQAGLNSLANGSTWTSEAVDNSSTLWQLVRANFEASGTGTTTAWLDIRLLPLSGDATNYATWNNGIVLKPTILTSNTEKNTTDYVMVPEKFKLAIKNNSGAALAASGNKCYWQGRSEKGV